MKTHEIRLKLLTLLWILVIPSYIYGQGGLLGSWKYVSTGGEMTMQITAGTIVINGQSFPYEAQGNLLMIDEGTATTPYPYMLDGNNLTLEFPGGMEVTFTRVADGAGAQSQLPRSMSKPTADAGPVSSNLTGKWLFQSQQGQLVLEFLSPGQLTFNGEATQFRLKEGVIQALGDYGWIDYPYTLSQGTLTITFPDGTRLPFTRDSSIAANQQEMNQNAAGGGHTGQLQGALCSWSGSSGSSSSYSRTQKIVFDGQGNFQVGSESSFSSNSGIAYGGNPNAQRGTYNVGDRIVTLRYQDGTAYEFRIKIRQDDGRITCLEYNGTLYAADLCD